MRAYHKVRGATVILGYINESGQEVQVRTFPAEFMDAVKLRNQLRQIEEQYKDNMHFPESEASKKIRAASNKNYHTYSSSKKAPDNVKYKDSHPDPRKNISEGLSDIIGGSHDYVAVKGTSQKSFKARNSAHANEIGKKKYPGHTIHTAGTDGSPQERLDEEGDRANAKKLYAMSQKETNPENRDRLSRWTRTKTKEYVNKAVLPGGRQRRNIEAMQDRNKVDYNLKEASMKDALERTETKDAAGSKKNKQKMTMAAQKRSGQWGKKVQLKEANEDPSLETTIHSFPLPPYHGHGDNDEDHYNYVQGVDTHFNAHLRLHGHGHQLTNKERQVALAHRHLSERGHISASKESIADHTNNKSGLANHARDKITHAMYGANSDAPSSKISGVLMHKLNRKIRDDHEQRARQHGREALNAVAQGGIYEGKQ